MFIQTVPPYSWGFCGDHSWLRRLVAALPWCELSVSSPNTAQHILKFSYLYAEICPFKKSDNFHINTWRQNQEPKSRIYKYCFKVDPEEGGSWFLQVDRDIFIPWRLQIKRGLFKYTMLQVGRSRDRSQWDGFFLIYLTLPTALWPWGRLSL
jgi:hypothetical protein